jgi:2-C-methyl-D-erythritol 4-phosphate cytidylyltransferase
LISMKVWGIIVAAGGSQRFGSVVPKQFMEICGRPLLAWTISRFENAASIDQIAIVVAEEYLLHTSRKVVDPFGFGKVAKIVIGGETRRQSVLNGLQALPISTGYVAIHDGARPLVKPDDIDRVVATARAERAALLAVPAIDTVKRARQGFVLNTLARDSLYLAQTPQVFQYDLIMAAHREAASDNGSTGPFTDDAALVEARGFKVKIVKPTGPNPKVTSRDDLVGVEGVLKRELDEKPESRPRL